MEFMCTYWIYLQRKTPYIPDLFMASVIEKLANLNLIMALSQNMGKIIQTLEIKQPGNFPPDW